MKNRSDKATQSPKTGSSKLKRTGKDNLGRKQSPDQDFESEMNDDQDLRMEQSGTKGRTRRSSGTSGKQREENTLSMSEFERGFYEGRRSIENELRSQGYERSGGRGSQGSRNQYGEHPESMGAEEYRGSNKRHPGLGQNDYIAGSQGRSRASERFTTSGRRGGSGMMDDDSEEQNYSSGNRRNEARNRNQNRENIEMNNYNDRSSGEMYRFPEDEGYDEYFEREFRNSGYQASGQTEGFGRRSGQQQGQDWEDQDEYRGGNAANRTGKGRYGNR